MYSALLSDASELSDKRCVRIASCCENPVLFMTTEGVPRIGARRCRDRLCPLCNALRSQQVERKIGVLVKAAPTCRFLTLTLKSSNAPLAEQLDFLTAAWRRLRQRQSWKFHVAGAVGTIECTWNKHTAQWHPHLHILFDGKFWKQSDISHEWNAVTDGSSIVDVRAVPDREKAAGYIAKYAAKPPKLRDLDAPQIIEWSNAAHRRRMIILSGTWARSKINPDDALDTPKPAKLVMPLGVLERHAKAGLPRPRRVIDLLWLMMPRAMEAASMPFRPPETLSRDLTAQEAITLRYDMLYLQGCIDWHTLPDGPAEKVRQFPPAPKIPQQVRLFSEAPRAPTTHHDDATGKGYRR